MLNEIEQLIAFSQDETVYFGPFTKCETLSFDLSNFIIYCNGIKFYKSVLLLVDAEVKDVTVGFNAVEFQSAEASTERLFENKHRLIQLSRCCFDSSGKCTRNHNMQVKLEEICSECSGTWMNEFKLSSSHFRWDIEILK